MSSQGGSANSAEENCTYICFTPTRPSTILADQCADVPLLRVAVGIRIYTPRGGCWSSPADRSDMTIIDTRVHGIMPCHVFGSATCNNGKLSFTRQNLCSTDALLHSQIASFRTEEKEINARAPVGCVVLQSCHSWQSTCNLRFSKSDNDYWM